MYPQIEKEYDVTIKNDRFECTILYNLSISPLLDRHLNVISC